MIRVNVNDGKFEANSFSESLDHIFDGLSLLERLYGRRFIVENWDDLNAHKKVSIEFAKDHKVSIQIAHVVG
jgi:hypothetical protein